MIESSIWCPSCEAVLADLSLICVFHNCVQVFRVPYEERAKIDGNNQFGESASSRICAEINSRTGAHIEISSAKDQSLTFLVTGKNDAVAKARRLVLEKFQTQARLIIKIPKVRDGRLEFVSHINHSINQ